MIKSILIFGLVVLSVLFGYFYFTNSADVQSSEKAKQAAIDVGVAVRDTGIAGLVDVRLKTKFGLDATRFLHTYNDGGNVIVYGLTPDSMDLQLLHDEVAKVPGVANVDVLVQPRPLSIKPLPQLLSGSASQPAQTP